MIFELFLHALPLLALIAAGAWCARGVDVPPAALGTLLIRVINPIVTFGYIADLPLRKEYLLLTPLSFTVAVSMCLIAREIARRCLSPAEAGVAALACISGNTTYFALPLIAVLLPDPGVLGIWMLLNAGLQLAEAGVGVYVASRGTCGVRESVRRVLSLPPFYAMLAGAAWNASGLPLPEAVTVYRRHAAGAGVIVGMALLGITLTRAKKLEVRPAMTALLLGMRFLAWPAACAGVVVCAAALGTPFSPAVALLWMLLGAVPLPVNAVAYAAHLKLPTGPVAACVLISTLIAPVSLPVLLYISSERLGFAALLQHNA